MTSNNVYSDILDDFKQRTLKVLKTVEQEIDKTQKKSDVKMDEKPAQPQTRIETNPVLKVQDRLNRLGYDAGPVDGVYREKTRQAIKAFKRDHNMNVDDQITERLVIALRKANNLVQAGDSSSKSSDGKQPLTLPQPSFQTSGNSVNKSVVVSGDAEAIKGRWLGYYKKINRTDTFFWLDIRLTGDRVEAELEAEFPPLALAGECDPDGHTIHLDPTHWVHGSPRGNFQLIGLKGHYVAEHDVIYGNLSNVQGSPSFVAGRDIRLEAPENPRGLLNKITADRKSAETLSIDDCRSFAEWLTGGNYVKSYGVYKFNSAVLNQNSMRKVLGRDMFQWQEEDSKKIKLINQACRRILSSSNDLGDKNLVKDIRVRVPQPLQTTGNKNYGTRSAWHHAKVLHKQDTIQNLKALKLQLDEGLIALNSESPDGTKQGFEGWESLVKRIEKGSGAIQIPGLENSNGITGVWRGNYGCDTAKYFMRLILERNGSSLTGVLEFGPGLKTMMKRGAFMVTGDVSDEGDEFKLSPQTWIFPPPNSRAHAWIGMTKPFGLQGRLSAEDGVIEGQVLGQEDCSKFIAQRLVVPDKPKNPDGLLFKITDSRNDTLTEDDCVKYASWLVKGEDVRLGAGGRFYSSLIKDFDDMRLVLGKGFYQFDEQDRLKISRLGVSCRKILSKSMDLKHIELYRKVKSWDPTPLGRPKFEWMINDWIIAEQCIHANDDAHILATRQFRDLQDLPNELESLKIVDEATKMVDKSSGPFEYMEEKGKTEHKANLLAFRLELEERIAQSIIVHFGEYATTVAGLRELEAFNSKKKEEFLKIDATHVVQKLEAAFKQEAGPRAEMLLKDKLHANMQVLSTLSDATYERLDEFKALDKEISKIKQFAYLLPKSSALEQSYKDCKDTYAKSYDDMIDRSSDDLVQWIESHPPNEIALGELKEFSLGVFGVEWSLIPDRYADIRNAINLKIEAYKKITAEQAKKQLALLEARQQKSMEKSKNRTKNPKAGISKIDPGLVKKATLQVLDKERDLYWTRLVLLTGAKEVLSQFREKRNKSLTAAEPELVRAVAKKDHNFDRILMRYLSVPGDRETATWKALMRQITGEDSAPDRERYIRSINHYYQSELRKYYQKPMEQGQSFDFAEFSLEPSDEGIGIAYLEAMGKNVYVSDHETYRLKKRTCVRQDFGRYICEYESGGLVLEGMFVKWSGDLWVSPTERERWGITKSLDTVRGEIAYYEEECRQNVFGSLNSLNMAKHRQQVLREKLSKWKEEHVKQKLN